MTNILVLLRGTDAPLLLPLYWHHLRDQPPAAVAAV